jgi:hypothetical protein
VPGRRSTRCSARRSRWAIRERSSGSALGYLLGYLLVALLAGACSTGDPARTAAERFVDAYYVEIDLPRARDAAVGLARAKVDDEMQLLSGQEGVDAASRPSVHYRFLEGQPAAAERDHRGFLFELTISMGPDSSTRKTLVTVRQDGGQWRAANFQEMD